MNSYYFSCRFEQSDWRMRALVYKNEYLFLYEVEPEDPMLHARFGIKFVTQPRDGFFDIRCSNPVKAHADYEVALLAGLEQYLVSQRIT